MDERSGRGRPLLHRRTARLAGAHPRTRRRLADDHSRRLRRSAVHPARRIGQGGRAVRRGSLTVARRTNRSVSGVSDLPAGWEWTTLEEVADWGSGGTPKATVSEYYDGTIPWAVIGD